MYLDNKNIFVITKNLVTSLALIDHRNACFIHFYGYGLWLFQRIPFFNELNIENETEEERHIQVHHCFTEYTV